MYIYIHMYLQNIYYRGVFPTPLLSIPKPKLLQLSKTAMEDDCSAHEASSPDGYHGVSKGLHFPKG